MRLSVHKYAQKGVQSRFFAILLELSKFHSKEKRKGVLVEGLKVCVNFTMINAD